MIKLVTILSHMHLLICNYQDAYERLIYFSLAVGLYTELP